MKKIVSQIAGAVAVVSAATFAFAQTNDTKVVDTQTRTSQLDKTTNSDVDLKSSETGSRFGPGANNGSTYNSAIRSTELKAGNVSSVVDPVPARTTTAAPVEPVAPAPIVTAAPEPAPIVEPAAPAVVATPEPTPAYVAPEPAPEPMRPARADRN
jgi:hypothetical protein